MKNQTCQARKGTKKGPKHATFTRCSDKTQGFSNMSTDILLIFMLTHDSHGFKSASPEGVDHLALPLVPEVTPQVHI